MSTTHGSLAAVRSLPGAARHAASERPIAWPILVIGRDNRFVHVLGERDFRFHHDGPGTSNPDPGPPGPLLAAAVPAGTAVPDEGDDDGEPAPAVPVDIFDRDGRRLRPVVGADFRFLGVEATAQLVATDVLMRRLGRAVRWALGEMVSREVDVVNTPRLPEGDYGEYLDELQRIFAARPDNGSAWHNLIHLIT